MPSLGRLGQRGVAVLVIVLSMLLAVGWYSLWYTKAEAHVSELNNQTQSLSMERNRGLAAKHALPQLKTTITNLQTRYGQFLKALPPKEELAQLLQTITQQAADSGVIINSFSRSPGRSKVPNVRSVSLTMRLQAPFPELYIYLKKLESMKRFSTISDLSLSLGGANPANPTINAGLVLTVYIYEGTTVGGRK